VLNTLLIFLGTGFGDISRYWISNITYRFLDRQFPYEAVVIRILYIGKQKPMIEIISSNCH